MECLEEAEDQLKRILLKRKRIQKKRNQLVIPERQRLQTIRKMKRTSLLKQRKQTKSQRKKKQLLPLRAAAHRDSSHKLLSSKMPEVQEAAA